MMNLVLETVLALTTKNTNALDDRHMHHTQLMPSKKGILSHAAG